MQWELKTTTGPQITKILGHPRYRQGKAGTLDTHTPKKKTKKQRVSPLCEVKTPHSSLCGPQPMTQRPEILHQTRGGHRTNLNDMRPYLSVLYMYVSPFTRCFRRYSGPSSTSAKLTQSLLCSLFTRLMGTCSHWHRHSLFTANGSSECCSSIHVLVCPPQTQITENKHTRSEKGANGIAMQGFIQITNHANVHH